MSGYDNMDPENRMSYEFSDISIRQGFIKKVYGILMVQLLITFGFIAIFLYVDSVSMWTQQNPGFFICVLILSIVMMIVLVCCPDVRRKTPTNFICLFIFTLAEGFLLGVSASTFQANSVLLAVGITVAVTLAITLFAFQTKWDFTTMGSILLVCSVVLILFGFLAIFLPASSFPIVNIVYASLGALLFSFYLIFDTQLLLGGKHKYSISPEEYVFAALSIYLDIINLFLMILQLVGDRR